VVKDCEYTNCPIASECAGVTFVASHGQGQKSIIGSIGKRRAAGEAAYPDSAATEWLQEGHDKQENNDASW
jgi:hypothetical protein